MENLKVLVRDFDQASSTGAAADGSRIQAGVNDNMDGVDPSQVQGSNLWIRREEPALVDEAALGVEGGERAGTKQMQQLNRAADSSSVISGGEFKIKSRQTRGAEPKNCLSGGRPRAVAAPGEESGLLNDECDPQFGSLGRQLLPANHTLSHSPGPSYSGQEHDPQESRTTSQSNLFAAGARLFGGKVI